MAKKKEKAPKKSKGKKEKREKENREKAHKFPYDVAVSVLGGLSCIGLALLFALIAFSIVSALLF